MDSDDGWTPEPDPSLEEMLRRARDVPLGNDWRTAPGLPPNLRPLPPDRADRVTRRLPGWASFLVGLAAGLALAALVLPRNAPTNPTFLQASATPPALPIATTPLPPAPTATPTATPWPTPPPTPTPSPIATTPLPTASEIVTLVQDFYDNQGPFAGAYLLRDVTNMRLAYQGNAQLAVCIAYDAAAVSAPDMVVGSNTRLFTLVATSDGSWQVAQMGGPDSCSVG